MKSALIAAALLGSLALPGLSLAQATAAPSKAPAATPAAPTLTPGTKVYGPQGEEVGTVDSVTGAAVVINTGTNRATLAKDAFGSSPTGPVIGMTKAQLDAAVEQAKAQSSAQLQAALVSGAEVRGKEGTVVGKIDKVEGDQVVLTRETGGPVALPRQQLTTDDQGLKLLMTAAEFEAAANAASASATSSNTDNSAG